LRLCYIDKFINTFLILFGFKTLDSEFEKSSINFPYLEKCIEAFPSCLIACHFLYFDSNQNQSDMNYTYLCIIVSFVSTSTPSFKFENTCDLISYTIMASSQVIGNCVLFGMVSTIDRPLSALFYLSLPIILVSFFFLFCVLILNMPINSIK
jgi:hypothetical protein